ncbi:MAG: hypothetical protein IKG23_08615 [Clostridia bacterium]|nr:hypothetical protein [Clostridia bacterium]
MSETHWKKLTNPNYLGAYAFDPGEEKIVTIEYVAQEEVIGAEGRNDRVIVAHLVNEKPLILNKTNCKAITKLLNTPYIEEWAGARITLAVQRVKAFGEDTDAVRVKPKLPGEICAVCGKEIRAGGGRSAAEIVELSVKKFGKKLCLDCAKEEKNNG